MALNFLWFDLPGHGGSFLARDVMMREGFADGHTCFLIGMLVASATACLSPRWFECHRGFMVVASAIVGTVALAVQYASVPVGFSVMAAVVTGVANIYLLIIDMLLLPAVVDRKVAGAAVVGTFVLRGIGMYASDACLGAQAQLTLLLALPALCAIFTGMGLWAVGHGGDVPHEPGLTFAKPLSTAMVGLLLLSSVAFAVSCAVGNTGFWGTPFALAESDWGVLCVGSVLFFAVTYATLVKTEASLLLRFLPGLLVLFVAYSFLYLGIGSQLGLSQAMFLALGHFAEYYGEAFSWFVILLAVRTLEMAPFRVIGLAFCVNSAMTVVFQYLLLLDGNSGLVIVQMGFLAMFAVLVWALYHFYGIGNQFRDARCAEGEPGAFSQDSAPPIEPRPQIIEVFSGGDDGGHLRSLAAAHRLSERETDVFLLLAHGHSRRYICDRLFIADGTASTHIGRIYEKMGVSSKQQLLSLVQDGIANDGVWQS